MELTEEQEFQDDVHDILRPLEEEAIFICDNSSDKINRHVELMRIGYYKLFNMLKYNLEKE